MGKSFLTVFLLLCAGRMSLAEQYASMKRDHNYASISYSLSSYNNDYQPPSCKPPPPCIEPNLLPAPIGDVTGFVPRVYHITGSTCWGALQVATALLGRPPRTNRELTEMCAAQFFGNIGKSYVSGYGRLITQICVIDGPECYTSTKPGDSDPGTRPELYDWENAYLLLSKLGHHAVFYRCINNTQSDFRLVTAKPYVSQRLANRVADLIVKFGFPLDQFHLMQCQPPTIYPPFQNYPIPAVDPSKCSAAYNIFGSSYRATR